MSAHATDARTRTLYAKRQRLDRMINAGDDRGIRPYWFRTYGRRLQSLAAKQCRSAAAAARTANQEN